MPISINPVFPVIAAQEAAPDLVLQLGTVIDARVVKVLDNHMVRIAISSLSIDVLSEVPLQPGATLKLAVSQTPDGLRLAIVPPTDGSGAGRPTAPMSMVTDLSAIMVPRPAGSPAPTPALTPVEALAVTAASQAAAVKQAGLSPLFANTAAAASSTALPEPVQAAALQLLATRPALTTDLTGGDVKSAFQNSGLFLESSLAVGAAARTEQGGLPDLKAALVVFRQTLSAWLDDAAPATPASPQAATSGAVPHDAAGPSPAIASLVPDIDMEEVYLPKALLPVAEEFLAADGAGEILPPGAQPASVGARAAAATAALNMLQDADGVIPTGVLETIRRMVDGKTAAEPLTAPRGVSAADDGFARTDVPPPPFRGAAPAPQPVASPSLAPDAAPAEAVRRLVDDADGAIARQTLLQIASLPDRSEVSGIRIDPGMPRWNFEIPFATPQGTAVAQFEISRDGGGKAAAAGTHQVWRARFSLDVEPAGPVHAIVSLSGETASVRMWAERPATAVRLRENAVQLSRALRQAELEPGDIVIGDGMPPQPVAVPPAGHFLDRAT